MRFLSLLGIPYHFLRAGHAFRHLSGDRLQGYQDRKARDVVRFADAHSPFYKRHWESHDLSDWRQLPPVDKALMMANFDRFNTRGITQDEAFAVALRAERERNFAPTVRGDITVGLSSGTSGHRGAFLVSPTETAGWAGTVLQRVLHRLPRPSYRVAFFLRSNSNLYERVNGRIRFRWFDLMTPLHEAIAALNTYQPDLLVAPPSLLGALSEAVRRGALRIAPERLVSVAEALEAQDRTMLESAFGAPVGQVYQCTEGFLAATCPEGRLHVNEDMVALQYEPLPGDPARVTPIITDLWRHTQPIVRYRLGDVLTLDDTPCPCGCGFQVIANVEGRCDDVCYFPTIGTNEPRRFYPDTIRRMILLADDCIADYAAIQSEFGKLAIHLSLAPGADFGAVRESVSRTVGDVLTQYDAHAFSVTICEGLPPSAPGAKRRRVIQQGESPTSTAVK